MQLHDLCFFIYILKHNYVKNLTLNNNKCKNKCFFFKSNEIQPYYRKNKLIVDRIHTDF